MIADASALNLMAPAGGREREGVGDRRRLGRAVAGIQPLTVTGPGGPFGRLHRVGTPSNSTGSLEAQEATCARWMTHSWQD